MGEIFRCAMKSLSRKRARTWLTVCSIAVGVTMVVIVSFISSAGKSVVNEELESMGISGLSVSCAGGQSQGLSEENLISIRNLSGVGNRHAAYDRVFLLPAAGYRQRYPDLRFGFRARQVISLKLKHGRLISRGMYRRGRWFAWWMKRWRGKRTAGKILPGKPLI